MNEGQQPDYRECPLHLWFELSYAQFLTVPRLVMQEMPFEWREKMAALLTELDETFDWRPSEGIYFVKLQKESGKLIDAPAEICDYRHGSAEHLRRKPQ